MQFVTHMRQNNVNQVMGYNYYDLQLIILMEYNYD